MKSKIEVWRLIENWQKDPCWDLEDSEGFEEYREFLREYSEYWLGLCSLRPMIRELEEQAATYEKMAHEARAKAKNLKVVWSHMREHSPEMKDEQ